MKIDAPAKLFGLSAQLVSLLRENSSNFEIKNICSLSDTLAEPPMPSVEEIEVGTIVSKDNNKKFKSVEFPQYLPSDLQPGILHVGAGNFFRSHLATYQHDLLNNDPDHFEHNKQWGIVGGGVHGNCFEKRKIIENQDWLQTVVERDQDYEKATIVGSMIDYMPVDHLHEWEVPHAAMTDKSLEDSIKIISLTITEGGYYLLEDGSFDVDHPDVQYDISNPDKPRTVFGILVASLYKRHKQGQDPFTVMSCDNLPHNGDLTKNCVLTMATHMFGKENPDFAEWVRDNVKCPNSMVDRITPQTTPEIRQLIQDNYGYDDLSAVVCEPFRQWVIEGDEFVNGERPQWELLETVTCVPKGQVEPYELRKIRILNGGHASLCYPAALLDVTYVHDVMTHPVLSKFLDTLEHEEICGTCQVIAGETPEEYWKLTKARFSNPTVEDTISRNCYDGASRQPKFIVPVVASLLKEGKTNIDGLATVSALWARYVEGKTESGKTIEPNDPKWDQLQALALDAKSTKSPLKWVDGLTKDVYGQDVGQNPVFREAFEKAWHNIQDEGVEAALKAYIDSKSK
mmetsp:Transcript_534/g.1363  ORF Transcript_534/g.1363 Transcript_534/m.1363 type:complete len:570 (+) Transcript_534:321-2030(+)